MWYCLGPDHNIVTASGPSTGGCFLDDGGFRQEEELLQEVQSPGNLESSGPTP